MSLKLDSLVIIWEETHLVDRSRNVTLAIVQELKGMYCRSRFDWSVNPFTLALCKLLMAAALQPAVSILCGIVRSL